ncbi:hypothetical protein ASE03_28025 [Kitasatospora sp. Root187]|nr:hypothetical protein ASE03_28025 [Kitasatospora sp. Root187]
MLPSAERTAMVRFCTEIWRVECSLAVAVTGASAPGAVGVIDSESTTTGSVLLAGAAQAAAPVPVAASASPMVASRRTPDVLRRCFECLGIRGRPFVPPRLDRQQPE